MKHKLDEYIEDFENKNIKDVFLNPLFRIKLTHILASIILLISALVFTENIIAMSIQLISAVVIMFHDLDDKSLKKALSCKIKDLKESEESLEKRVAQELVKNEEINREILEQQRALDEHAIVAKTDIDAHIVYVNDKFAELCGYTKEELEGKNHSILSSGVHSHLFWKKMFEQLLANKTWHDQICNKRKDGSLYWLELSITPMHDKVGNIRGYIAIGTDITRQKEEEKELEKAKKIAEESTKTKSEFLASMSHEIRTPLNAILGFVTLLKKLIKEEKPREYLDIIDTSGKSLLTIINDILDFSKMQSGQFVIDKYEVKTLDEFNKAVMLFSSRAYEKNLIYIAYIDPNLPSIIKIDAIRVNQILSNLLSNAIKFTPKYGQVKVSIFYENDLLHIQVQDSGIGISKQDQAKLFSAFSQIDSSTTRKYGGTGLGLSISSMLTELMGGKLSVESEEGKGATFTLQLPVEIIKKEPAQIIDFQEISQLKFALLNNCQECQESVSVVKQYLESFGAKSVIEIQKYQKDGYDILFFMPDEEYNEEIIEAGKSSVAMLRADSVKLARIDHIVPLYAPFTTQTIIEAINDSGAKNIKHEQSHPVVDDDEVEFQGKVLVAEDNKTNQMLIKLLLADFGLNFSIANDGVEAVEMFKKDSFDLVLMDENMPNLNGIAALHQIREYEHQNKLLLTPVIALTANALESDREKFLEAGMDGFVAKPIDIKSLMEEFDKYLKRLA